jgi:hypothetical protein
MFTKTVPGLPVGGLNTVGKIIGTNDLVFDAGPSALQWLLNYYDAHDADDD